MTVVYGSRDGNLGNWWNLSMERRAISKISEINKKRSTSTRKSKKET
jgi:hypothetical protein